MSWKKWLKRNYTNSSVLMARNIFPKRKALLADIGVKKYMVVDCPSALRYISKGQYIKYRVFFKDEETAIAAGYRPCSVCMKEAYKQWKAKTDVV